jgi:hypothetical protein
LFELNLFSLSSVSTLYRSWSNWRGVTLSNDPLPKIAKIAFSKSLKLPILDHLVKKDHKT